MSRARYHKTLTFRLSKEQLDQIEHREKTAKMTKGEIIRAALKAYFK